MGPMGNDRFPSQGAAQSPGFGYRPWVQWRVQACQDWCTVETFFRVSGQLRAKVWVVRVLVRVSGLGSWVCRAWGGSLKAVTQ